MMKKLLALFLVVLMSIESFGAVIGDNDGSAFITKAEFDSLKNNFQSQIDQYNTSIDSKIDGAIAAYLAGISFAHTTTLNFAIGSGELCMIVDTDKINDLSWGHADLDLAQVYSSHPLTSLYRAGFVDYIHFKRSKGDYKYELFNIDSEKKKFINYENEAKISLNGMGTFVTYGDLNRYSEVPDGFYPRWHACALQTILPNLVRQHAPSGSTNYSDRVYDANWWMHYGTQVHGKAQNMGFYNPLIVHNTSLNCAVEPRRSVKFIFENSFSNTNLWLMPFDTTAGLEQVVTNDVPGYRAESLDNKLIYDKPSDVEDLTISVWTWGYGTSEADGSRWTFDNATWLNTGTFDGTGWGTDTTRVTALPWYEFLLEGQKLKGRDLINNNIPTLLLADYDSYGYKGKLEQGLPIGIMPSQAEVEFDLDTTTIEEDVVLAFSTLPFTNGSTSKVYLENSVDDYNLNVFIDGIDQHSSKALIAPGLHKIKVQINALEKVPLFWKMAYESTLTTSPRKFFNIPLTYQLTDNT